MSNVFLTVLNMSVTAAFVIAALCLARLVLQKIHAPKWISYVLWAVAGFRLTIPFSFESMFSLLPFTSKPVPSTAIIENVTPFSALAAGYHAIGDAMNGGLGTVTMYLDEPGYIPTTEAYHSQVWLTLFQYVWVAGIVAMLLYAVISYIRLIRRKDSIKTPFVYGFFNPKIHIPNGLEGEERRYVTLHEQTHIKRHDHIIKMFAFALLCVHWFNPFAWVAFVLLCADMEMSCDEKVLTDLGMGVKADYSQTLLSLSTNHRILNASPLAFGEGGIKGRVKNVLKFKKASRIVVITAVVLAVSLTVGLSLNRAAANIAMDMPVQATISYEGKSAVIALDNKDSIPYVELGSTISLNFADSRPMSVSVIEVIATADGSRRYGEPTDRTLEIELSGNNLVTFAVEKNWADALSSYSGDYQPGNSFRWYRIICEDGEKSVEYGLWLRTDPAFIMNIEPNGVFEPAENYRGIVVGSTKADVLTAFPEIIPEEQRVKALWFDDYESGVRVSFYFDDNELDPRVERIGTESISAEPMTEATQDELNRPALLGISMDGKDMILVTENVNKIVVAHTISGQTERVGLRDEQAIEALAEWIKALELEHYDFVAGQTPGDSDGGELWSFDINGIDALFTYGNYGGGECYIIYGGEWYKVQNPSAPVIN